MAEHLGEVDELLAADLTPAEFLDALQSAGQLLGRAEAVFFNLVGTDADDALRAVQEEFSPRLSAHHDAVRLDPRVVERVRALHEDPRWNSTPSSAGCSRSCTATPSAPGPCWTRRSRPVAGAERRAVPADDAVRRRAARRHQRPRRPRRRRRRTSTGLAAAELARAAAAGGERGGYLLPLVLPTGQPVLESLRRRQTRRLVHEASVSRGAAAASTTPARCCSASRRCAPSGPRCSATPTTPPGSIADETAGDVEAAVGHAAPPRPRRRRQRPPRGGRTHRAAPRRRRGGTAAALGLGLLRRAVRRQRFAVDAEALRPWFELDRVLVDGVFATATRSTG